MPRISDQSMKEIMRPFVGSTIVDNTDFCRKLTDALRDYAPYKDTLYDLAERLERAVFNGLYDILGENMTLCLDDGTYCRVYMNDFPQLADEALSVLFEGMEVYSKSYSIISSYAVKKPSLGAMRVLYTRYAAFQTDEERAYLKRVIRESYPEERYRAWLDTPANNAPAESSTPESPSSSPDQNRP